VEAVEVDPGTITSVAPLPVRQGVSKALEKAIGCAVAARRSVQFERGDADRLERAGPVVRHEPGPVTIPGAALTDQSDAWAAFQFRAPTRATC
jgi:hypothetical protein